MLKKWLFIRKLNKTIKEYGAKSRIQGDMLVISMRNYQTPINYYYLRSQYPEDNKLINFVIKEIKIKMVKEVYE